MVIEKRIVKIDKDLESTEDSQTIKTNLDNALEEQKRVRKMIDLFILALFLVFVMFMIS